MVGTAVQAAGAGGAPGLLHHLASGSLKLNSFTTRVRVIVGLFCLAAITLADNVPYMVRDVEGVPTPPSFPTGFIPFGDQFVFSASTPETGTGVYISDGTPDGTRLLAASLSILQQGEAAARPFVRMGDRLYFIGFSSGGSALWSTDGTPEGTWLVSAAVSYNWVSDFVVFNGLIYFGIYDSIAQTTSLWRSDGTGSGTVPFFAGPFVDGPLAAFGDRLLFLAEGDASGAELWTTDGTIEGTSQLMDLYPGFGSGFLFGAGVMGGAYYFVGRDAAHGAELWRSDGTIAGTQLVRDIVPGPGSALYLDTYQFARMGDSFVFMARTAANGTELWRSDGSEAGTQLFLDYAPGSLDGMQTYYHIAATNNRAFVQINTTTVMTTDGTVDGTRIVPIPGHLALATSQLAYFAGYSSGTSCFRSDGTVEGTYTLPVQLPTRVTVFGDRVVFSGVDPDHGAEPWISDGSVAGTQLISDIAHIAAGDPANLADIHGTLLFSSHDPAVGIEPFRTRGTAATTALIADINPGVASSVPAQFSPLGEEAIFHVAASTQGPANIFVTTGGLSNALVSSCPAADMVYPFELNGFGFVSSSQIWRTNGPLSNALPFAPSATPVPFGVLGNQVLLFANQSNTGYALWVTNGILSGTSAIDIPAGPADYGTIRWIDSLGDRAYYFLQNAPNERIWSTNGTPAGTYPVPGTSAFYPSSASPSPPAPATILADSLYFCARFGSASGPQQVVAIDGPGLPPRTIAPALQVDSLAAADDRLFAGVSTPADSAGIWVSSGAGDDIARILDISAGSSNGFDLRSFDGDVYFAAADAQHGRELWRSGGTPETTQLVMDLNPGGSSGNPNYLTVSGDRLYFAANDGVHGTELWALTRTVRGDVDGDGDSDLQDLALLLSNYGGAGPQGDLNHDGVVDLQDLSDLLANFGDRIEP